MRPYVNKYLRLVGLVKHELWNETKLRTDLMSEIVVVVYYITICKYRSTFKMSTGIACKNLKSPMIWISVTITTPF